MFCKNCGNELPELAKFCSSCGTPVSAAAPEAVEPEIPAAPAPAATPVPVYAEPAPVVEAAAPVAAVPEVAGENAPILSGGKKNSAKTIAILGIAVVALVLIIFGVTKLFSGGNSKTIYTYVNDDYEMMYLKNLKEKTEAVEVSDEANRYSATRFSKDGKYLYFIGYDDPEYSGSEKTLYYMAVSKIGKDGEKPEKISADVERFWVLENGKVAYMKSDSGDYQLRLFDGKESTKLASGIVNLYDVMIGEDESYAYYSEYDNSDNTTTLYRVSLGKESTKEKLIKGATMIYSAWDAEVLVYGEYNGSSGEYDRESDNYTIYSCVPGGEKTKIVGDAASIVGVDTDGTKVTLYYTTRMIEEYTLYDFVTDKHASTDQQVTAVSLEYPDWYSYYPWDIYEDDLGGYYYEDYNGNRHDLDPTGINDFSDAWTAAYEEADALYNAAMDEYNAKYEEYAQAEWRMELRDYLKNNEYSMESYTLHKYADGKVTDIATDVSTYNLYASVKDDVLIYQKIDAETGTVAELADLTYYDEVYYFLQDSPASNVWYQNVGGTESTLAVDADEDESVYIYDLRVLNGKEAVMRVCVDDDDAVLYSYKLDKSSLSNPTEITDEEIDYIRVGKDSKDNDVLYYFIDVDYDNYPSGDLMCYSNGTATPVADEIYQYIQLEESGTEYVFADCDYSDRAEALVGEFSVIKDGKTVSVADDVMVGSICYLDGKQAMYISDEDLYLWNGTENRKLASDVIAFWASSGEAYNTYSVY